MIRPVLIVLAVGLAFSTTAVATSFGVAPSVLFATAEDFDGASEGDESEQEDTGDHEIERFGHVDDAEDSGGHAIEHIGPSDEEEADPDPDADADPDPDPDVQEPAAPTLEEAWEDLTDGERGEICAIWRDDPDEAVTESTDLLKDRFGLDDATVDPDDVAALLGHACDERRRRP